MLSLMRQKQGKALAFLGRVIETQAQVADHVILVGKTVYQFLDANEQRGIVAVTFLYRFLFRRYRRENPVQFGEVDQIPAPLRARG